jgi:hypothetical protein
MIELVFKGDIIAELNAGECAPQLQDGVYAGSDESTEER